MCAGAPIASVPEMSSLDALHPPRVWAIKAALAEIRLQG